MSKSHLALKSKNEPGLDGTSPATSASGPSSCRSAPCTWLPSHLLHISLPHVTASGPQVGQQHSKSKTSGQRLIGQVPHDPPPCRGRAVEDKELPMER